MSLADDLRSKLDEAIGGLETLRARLDEIEGLKESLRDANGQLFETSSHVSELVLSARAAQESLDLTVRALEQAIDVMMRLEPAVITSAIQEADTSIKAAIENSTTKLSESVNASQESIQQQMAEKETRHTERHAKDARTFKWIGSLAAFALAALVVLAIFTLLSVQ